MKEVTTQIVEVKRGNHSRVARVLHGKPATKCDTYSDVCGQIDHSSHKVPRWAANGQVRVGRVRIGNCKKTGKPCFQLAELIAGEL